MLDLLCPHLVQAHRKPAALTQARRDAYHSTRGAGGSGRDTIVLSGKDRSR